MVKKLQVFRFGDFYHTKINSSIAIEKVPLKYLKMINSINFIY